MGIVLAVLLLLAVNFAGMRKASSVNRAAREFSSMIYFYRSQAVRERRAFGIRFRDTLSGYEFGVYGDGDGDGIRSNDIENGTEELIVGPFLFEERYRGVKPLVLGPWPVPAPPPSRGMIDNPSDPVKFGRSDTLSITPRGTSNGGSLYLSDGEGRMWAVVTMATTLRTRLWEYDSKNRSWTRR